MLVPMRAGGELGNKVKKRVLNYVKTLSVSPLLMQGRIHVFSFNRECISLLGLL